METDRIGMQKGEPLKLLGWLWDDAEMWDFVHSRYSEPQRHYHTLGHVRWLVRKAVHLNYHSDLNHHSELQSPNYWATMSALIVFHDIVYDPTAKGGKNEIESAVLARLRLDDASMDVDTIVEGIEATITHQSDNPFIQNFLDLDMGILSATPSDYHDYAKAVRREYAHVSLDQYVKGRCDFLGSQLDREAIYFHETRTGWDQASRHFSTPLAHDNMAMEMGYLRHMPRRYLGE